VSKVFSTECYLGTPSRLAWNLEMLVFEERGKPEYQERNLLEQREEPITNSIHIRRRVRESNSSEIRWDYDYDTLQREERLA